jgi:hypothetical protein
MKQVFIILFMCFLFMVPGCVSRPGPVKKELVIETFIAPAVSVSDRVLSTEPIVFVRCFSLSPSGAKDLDQLLENKLLASKHRLSSRSVGAEIKITAQLVYLGECADISAEQTLQLGFGGEKVNNSVQEETSQPYAHIAIVDLEVKIGNGLQQEKQQSRILAGVRYPMPAVSPGDLRAALLDQIASQISVFFEF